MDTELMDARKVCFLETYARTGIIQPACDAADISRTTYKNWRNHDDDFDVACDDALQAAVDVAEGELRRRGVEGVSEPVMWHGEPIWRRDPVTGEVLLDDDFNPIPYTRYARSDRLLEVYLKAHRAQYRDRSGLELTGADGGPVATTINVVYVKPKKREGDEGAPRPADA